MSEITSDRRPLRVPAALRAQGSPEVDVILGVICTARAGHWQSAHQETHGLLTSLASRCRATCLE